MKCAKDDENQESRGLRWQQNTMNMALLPWCLQDPKASIVRILKNKIGKYDKELNGIVISYKNVKVLQNFGCIRQDTAEINVDVQIEFLIFQPEVGTKLHGIINKKSVTHLSVLVHKIFNVVIPRPTDDVNFKWVGDQLNVGQKIPFTIVVVDLFGALPYIRGDLDESLLNFAELEEKNSELYEDCSKLTAVKVSFDAAKPKISNNIGTNGNNTQSTSDFEKTGMTENIHKNLSEKNESSSSDEDESDNPEKNNKQNNSTTSSDSSTSDIEKTGMTENINKNLSEKNESCSSDEDESYNPKKNNKRNNSTTSSDSSTSTSNNVKYKDKRKTQNAPNKIIDEPKVNNKKRKRSSIGIDDSPVSALNNIENGNKKKKVKLETKTTHTESNSSRKTSNPKNKMKKVELVTAADSDSDSSDDDIVSMRNKILQEVMEKTFSPKPKSKKKSKT